MSTASDDKREALDALERMLTQVPDPEYPCETPPWDYIRKQLRRGLSTRALAGLEYRIRRLYGDMKDPSGGVRHVIPETGNYSSK